MSVSQVLNDRINERGITVSELSRRVGMNDEALRRSIAGYRNLKADEFIQICHVMDLNINDFLPSVCDVDSSVTRMHTDH